MISFHSWLENVKINRDRGERSVVQHPNFVHKANLSKNQHRRKTNFEKSEKEILKIFERTFFVNFKGVLSCVFLLTEFYLQYASLKPNRNYFAIDHFTNSKNSKKVVLGLTYLKIL